MSNQPTLQSLLREINDDDPDPFAAAAAVVASADDATRDRNHFPRDARNRLLITGLVCEYMAMAAQVDSVRFLTDAHMDRQLPNVEAALSGLSAQGRVARHTRTVSSTTSTCATEKPASTRVYGHFAESGKADESGEGSVWYTEMRMETRRDKIFSTDAVNVHPSVP